MNKVGLSLAALAIGFAGFLIEIWFAVSFIVWGSKALFVGGLFSAGVLLPLLLLLGAAVYLNFEGWLHSRKWYMLASALLYGLCLFILPALFFITLPAAILQGLSFVRLYKAES